MEPDVCESFSIILRWSAILLSLAFWYGVLGGVGLHG